MKPSLKELAIGVWTAMLCLLAGCGPTEPLEFLERPQPPLIYPDYSGTTIPPNIAPLNFEIREDGDNFVTKISGKNGDPVLVSGKRVAIPQAAWRDLLEKNQDGEISFLIYAKKDKTWQKYAAIVNSVAKDLIDDWITYRLIEPGYELYATIEINQRNLSSFEERPFFNNERTGRQCANCHAFQNWRTDRMLFHTRQHKSGTIFVQNGQAKKIDLKTDEVISAGVYPGWHPDLNLVAFSVNTTGQLFHTASKAKVEVLDSASDLVLYDVETNELSHILRTDDDLETFPSWSHDGKWLYYCSARVIFETGEALPESFYGEKSSGSQEPSHVIENYDKIHYNLMRLPFDRETKMFGVPEIVVDAAAREKSVSFPRLSPDGRYIMYTLSDFGSFSIWHPESDLWLHDLKTGEDRPLHEVNSDAAESFHNWSSNGRWFVFTSRRDDGSYTRLYLAHFDEEGVASKPFLLPQYYPEQNLDLMKSYNVPEFTVEPIKLKFMEQIRAINREPQRANYRER